jgi:hypothetical protein
MKRDALATSASAAGDPAPGPMHSARTRRRWLAPILAPAITLGLLAAVAVGPASASPALAASPETTALSGFHLIRDPPRPGADAQPNATAHGFNIIAVPPRPTGPQREVAASAVDGFNVIVLPPRPNG